MPTIALNPLTLPPTTSAFPPAIGTGAGNGNDVNIPATVTGRSRALAPLIMTRNVPDNGAVSVTIVLTSARALALGGNAIPSIAASVSGTARVSAPLVTPTIALSIGQTLLVSPANVLAIGMQNAVGAGATVSGSAATSLVVPVAPSLAIEVNVSAPSALVYAIGIAQTLTLAQSPLITPAIVMALGMSGFVSGGQGPNVPSGSVGPHDVIRAKPRPAPAQAKREN